MSNAVITKKETKKGSIAQLVQSVCLTSRGSGVRLPLLPPPELSGKNIPVRKACMQGKFRKFGTDGQHGSGQAVQACCAFVL